MSTEWYYVDNVGSQAGPVGFAGLTAAWKSGSLDASCLVWNDEMDSWMEVSALPAVLARLQNAAAPAAAAPAAAQPAIGGMLAGLGSVKLRKTSSPSPSPTNSGGGGGGGFDPSAIKKVQLRKSSGTSSKSASPGSVKVERFKKSSSKRDETRQQKLEQERAEARAKKGQEAQWWQELYTTDGLVYYYNRQTNVTTWDKPECLKTDEELGKAGDWVWMPHDTEAFVAARILETGHDGRVTVQDEAGQSHVMKRGTLLEPLVWSQLQRTPRDLVMLDAMNEPLILHNLRKRFKDNEIYTNVGTILISLNPYKRLPLYTPSVISDYRYRGNKQLAPHVFVIADDAYSDLVEHKKNQSIVISGESGAGKTECMKQALQYLAEVAGSENNVEQLILLSNPILESFGNAKTVRNNNSSRFGKYIDIFFDGRASICGAMTTNYLLEKSRVVYQAPGDRNFHVFYQLCAGASAEQRARYHLSDAETFNYCNQSGDVLITGVSDADEFAEMEDAMRLLGFSDEDKDNIFRITCAVMHLGNITFRRTGDRECAVSDESSMEIAAHLLDIEQEKLRKGLITKIMRMPGSTEDITITLSDIEARDARDAMSKFVYAHLFDWLVQKINELIGSGGPAQRVRSIGILDIFGFEIFEANSFEQLCINYANEKLQQFFNAHTFKLEEAVYESERIAFEHVHYIDNQPVLDLIEKKPHGIFCMLDEELRMPKGSDESFVRKLIQNHNGRSSEFDTVLASSDMFAVHHYAGAVGYDSRGFLDKNKDRLNDDTYQLFSMSNFAFLKDLFPSHAAASRKTSLATKFATQLNDLMNTLNGTEPHYIRCIKPNPNKAPLEFVGTMVLEQLRYSGVHEAITIRKQGYPFRLTHEDFWKRYKCVLPKKKWPSAVDACQDLIVATEQDVSQIQIGVTRVLYRAEQHRNIELRRNLAVEQTVIFLQSHVRAWLARRLSARLREIKPVLAAAIKTRELSKVEAALEKCSGVQFELLELVKARQLQYILIEERRVNALLKDLVDKDPEENFEALSKAVASADDIDLQSDLAKRARKKLGVVKDMRKCRQDLKAGVDEADEEKLTWAINKAKELKLNASAEIRRAEEMLERIRKEKQIAHKLQAACDNGGWLRTGDLISWGELDAALADARAFGMKTKEGLRLERLADILSDVRKTMEQAMLGKERSLWDAASAALTRGMEEFDDHPEIMACLHEVSQQAAMEDVAAQLQAAIEALDHDTLSFALSQAKQMQMPHDQYPVVPIAQQYMDRMVECRALMQRAQATLDQTELVYAIEYADSFYYNTEEVERCRATRDTVVQLNADAAYANDVLTDDLMRDVIARADAIHLDTPDVQRLKTLLLDTPEEKLVQLQLKAAVKFQDPSRVTRITIRLKDLFFAKSGAMFEFANFPLLRSRTGWADLKFLSFHRDELKQGMLHWTQNPIHASLMEMDSRRSKEACKMFKNIMGFMGDRAYSDPMLLAQEVLIKCLEQPYLRDEIYCQLVKQLEKNVMMESHKKGWQMMALCLETFPPKEFENYLEMYLRTKAPDKERFTTLLHNTVYGGERHSPPTLTEMNRIILGETLRGSSFGSERTYVAPQAVIPSSGRAIPSIHEDPVVTPETQYDPYYEQQQQQPRPPPPSLANPNAGALHRGHGPRLSLSLQSPPRIPQPPRPAGPPRGQSQTNINEQYDESQDVYGNSYSYSYSAGPGAPPASGIRAPPTNMLPPKPSQPRPAAPARPPAPARPAGAPTRPPAPAKPTPPAARPPPPPKPPASTWQVAYNPEGIPYYYNESTGAVQWERPANMS